MSICLLMIGDGRDEYHERAYESAFTHGLRPYPSAASDVVCVRHVVAVDDREHRLGFAGAIAEGWRRVLETGAEWCFHLEMDFTFDAPVALDGMIGLLEDQEHLVQVSLKRQAVNAEELAAGGLVERDPDAYRQRVAGGVMWTEHRQYFTTNPSVYSTRLCRHGWPQVDRSEGVFTHRLLEDPDARFAIWGAKFDAPLVHHIGEDRAGTGY